MARLDLVPDHRRRGDVAVNARQTAAVGGGAREKFDHAYWAKPSNGRETWRLHQVGRRGSLSGMPHRRPAFQGMSAYPIARRIRYLT